MAITYTPLGYYHNAPLFLLSGLFCLLLFLFHRERHTPCRSGLSLHNWNTFYFFEKKKKERNELEVVIRLHSYQDMLPDWQLYLHDLNNNPISLKSLFVLS